MIKIYPNKLEGEAFETHTVNRRMTIGSWLNSIRKEGYKFGDRLPLSAMVNGEIIDQEEWHEFVFKPSDALDIFIEPRGSDPFTITAALFGGFKAVLSMLTPKLPGTPNVPGSGDALSDASAKGNKVKLGDVIRESFGTQKIYPDYLLPPHKYFSDPRTQWTEMLLCVGKGKFQINANDVRIGDTPLISLGSEAEYQIFQPGEAVAGSAAVWWHQAPEVGSSSTGAAGLELTASTSITTSPTGGPFVFNGYTISIPVGAGSFPADWAVGMVLRVIAPYTYTVTDGGAGLRDVVTGPLGMLNPTAGDRIEIAGNNAGTYIVNSYTGGGSPSMTLNYSGGSAATALTVGTGQAAIEPLGMRFKITAKAANSITVDRLDESGSVDSSFPGFDSMTSATATVSLDGSSLEGGWRGPFPACPENEKTSTLEWDMFFPNGLCGVGREGQIYDLEVSYDLQYRDMNIGGAWTTANYSHIMNTLDQIGFTTQLDLPYPMRAEVRMRKAWPLGENLEWHDTIQWYALRSRLTPPASYAGCTTITVRIRSSDRIAAQTESLLYVIATRLLPTRSASAWTTESATRDIVPAFCYIAKSLGYIDGELDLAELDRLDALWKSRGDRFDAAVTSESTAKQVLNDALGAGYAELTIDRGVIRPVRDEVRTTFEHMYTPQNFTRDLVRDIQLFSPDDFDGVDVTYQDSSTWTEEVVKCRLPGDIGRKVEKITATGVTDKTKAWRLGMRRLRTHRYRRDTYSWSTELDALNSRYMSYCMAADDVPGYGQSSLLMGFSSGGGTVTLESSEPMDWSTPGAHMVALRRPDGSVSGPYVATRVDDYRMTVLSLDFTPDVSWKKEPPHMLFGPSNRLSYPVLVTSVSPNGSAAASVEAIGYNPLVYADDDNSPT